ncbi:MAG: hypothetical protein JWO67_4741 [Streptosporangiaceae bacterium]|jgi:MFS family permease|nr:hypothetical protein [Streptosporangiaceae bacterium]
MGVRAHITSAGRSVRAAVRGTARITRRATHAQGAGRSGLGSLIEAQAVNSAADALVAVALVGTIFFGLDVSKARGQVALYLLVTMAPFVLVAPLIGPALDRARSARRVAMAGTMLARGLLCWGMAGAVSHGDQVTFLPAAFGVLVLSKAFGVLRSAVTPRVLPAQITLVTANARASFAGLIAASVIAPVGAGLGALIGPDWLLRIAMLVFIVGAVLGVRLPRHVDAPESAAEPDRAGGRARWRTLLRVGPAVGEAMLANAALRAFSGFLILYLAFLLRDQRFDPVSPNLALGLLAACAGAGGLVGTMIGARMKARAPQLIVFGTLAFTTVVAAVGAIFFGLWAALAVAFVGAFGQSLGKLSMDAIVQREIGEEVRSSTFAVSETLHQLVWVLGGLIGLGMSTGFDGRVAFTSVAAVLGLSLALLIVRRVRRRVPRRSPGRAADEAAQAAAKSP